MSGEIQFPKSFLWGSATAAFQIEGSPLADGAGPSIWTRFTKSPGNMFNGDNGDIATDHYNRWSSDIDLMKQIGMKAYRFSTSWSRILPCGRGQVNQKGLDFYERLIDKLLENDIEPLLTLYHWDLPAALDDIGGWLNRDISDYFADYGEVLFRKFDGRVKKWVTLNEPWVVTDGGYLFGALAPGHKSRHETPIASHNLLRSHGAAVKRYREIGQHEIGLVVNIEPKYPNSDSPEDKAATKRAEAYMNRQYLDPAFKGQYPGEMAEIFEDAWPPEWPKEDYDLISQKNDFIGINYYTRAVTAYEPNNWHLKAKTVRVPHKTYTETGWEVFEQGLYDTLTWFKANYGDTPLYITENGSAFFDPPKANNGKVHDPLRVDYMQRHLKTIHRAIQDGVDIRGYMVWSLLDNLEWSLGYSKRFGIIHVDYETMERTLKDSAKYYSQIIKTNGGALTQEDPFEIILRNNS